MPKIKYFLVASLIFAAIFAFMPHSDAGKIELTTYYPAPMGEYKELSSTENANFATDSGKVGIGTITPAAKLEVNGEIKVGNTSVACDPTVAGSIRYNTTKNEMEFCNAVQWTSLGNGRPKAYGAVLATQVIVSSTAWTDVGLSVNVTPSSQSSSFLINANVVSMNAASSTGSCSFGLFKNVSGSITELAAPFHLNTNTDFNVFSAGVTYLDNSTSLASRIYTVMVRENNAGQACYVTGLIGQANGKSTLTVLDIP